MATDPAWLRLTDSVLINLTRMRYSNVSGAFEVLGPEELQNRDGERGAEEPVDEI